MVRNEGFEPPIVDSESTALPLGEFRVEKKDNCYYTRLSFLSNYFYYFCIYFVFTNQSLSFKILSNSGFVCEISSLFQNTNT